MDAIKQILKKGEELLTGRRRKKFAKEIIVNAEALENRVAVLEDGQLEEFSIERTTEKQIVASVFKGRIRNLEPGLKAAFVDIGFEKNAFLHYWDIIPEQLDQRVDLLETPEGERAKQKPKISQKDIPQLYPAGSEVIVQVVKGPIGTKGPRVTTNISIPGRYLVLMPFNPQRGISRKIEDDRERQRLKKILQRLRIPEGMGVIVRTVGENQKKRYFIRDLELLLQTWKQVEQKIKTQPAPCCVFQEPDLVERTVRDFLTEEVDRIVVDHEAAYERIRNMIGQISRRSRGKVRLYTEPTPIFSRFNVEKQIENAFRRQVWLKSGGYICIDETEALVAIDINTGRHKSQKDLDTTILQTNLEAADEICRQLRLRNIGGLIVIDFIDMRHRSDQQKVTQRMREGVRRDKAKTRILNISQLGLIEMTRQRHSESMASAVYEDCPYCKGKGMVKSALSMSVEIQRKIAEILRKLREQGKHETPQLRIFVHPEVLSRLRTEDEALLIELEKKLSGKLSFRADPSFHFEQFKIADAISGQDLA
ncbi:MAG TPA: Rne/Rng family ribonuclease [Verrucomicrobiae bacterium]|nr:Rne/Rng family ribonuclease [Verrucomicrobiae bacterium]